MFEKYIDYTNLKADATAADIKKLCEDARAVGCPAVCVNPCRVHLAAEATAGSGVAVCTVVGFPLGAGMLMVKVNEANKAIKEGATEIDMVINIGYVKDGKFDYVRTEIAEMVRVCRQSDVVLKVIIETCLLAEKEKREVIELVAGSGAQFIKTSTGMSTGGATVEDIKLMKDIGGSRIKIKASGGVRDAVLAKQLMDAGADRIGSSKLF